MTANQTRPPYDAEFLRSAAPLGRARLASRLKSHPGPPVKPAEPDGDETVRQALRRGSHRDRFLVGAAVVAVVVLFAALVFRPVSVAPPHAPIPGAVADPEIEAASIGQIRAHRPIDVSVFRLAETPRVVVVDFASLAKQGRMLDRIAALTEKAGLPRDRILTPDELERAVKVGGDMATGFYYGHDYSAASLRRFFSIAERDKVALTPEEAMLRRVLQRAGWLDPGAVAGLISVPGVGADERVTPAARNAILSHELSHAAYFSDPDYAAYVHRFVAGTLTAAEQSAFRGFLGREGYDVANAELMENETHAYLVFTPDPLFFTPALVGMQPERRTELRQAFQRGMADGWLKEVLAGVW